MLVYNLIYYNKIMQLLISILTLNDIHITILESTIVVLQHIKKLILYSALFFCKTKSAPPPSQISMNAGS